jgi:hypothetical protein
MAANEVLRTPAKCPRINIHIAENKIERRILYLLHSTADGTGLRLGPEQDAATPDILLISTLT